MDGPFDVFDSWGNKVGEFTPAGGGFNGMLAIIVLVFAWTIGISLYLVVRLIVDGFSAATRGDWLKALTYWAIPVAIVVCINMFSLLAVISEQVREFKVRQTQEEIRLIKANPTNYISIERVGGVPYSKCTGLMWVSECGEYLFTNNSSLNINIARNVDCKVKGWEGYATAHYKIRAGETIGLYCAEGYVHTPVCTKMKVYHADGYDVLMETEIGPWCE